MPISDDDLNAARDLLAQALARLTPVTQPSNIVNLVPGASLQAAHDAKPEGTIFKLADGNYAGGLVISKNQTWTTDGPTAKPTLIAAGTVVTNKSATSATFDGLSFRSSDPLATVFDDSLGSGLVLRNFDIGPVDALAGQRRGIRCDGKSFTIQQGKVWGCALPKKDAQAISAWDGASNGVITDCQFFGGAEGLMFGGADSTSLERIPTSIMIQRCLFSKDPAWYAAGMQIKCGLELKSCRKISILDSVVEYGGIAEGQNAYGMDLTVRNQGGKAPWSVISDVLLQNLLVRQCAGGVNFLGSDDTVSPVPKPSDTMARVTLTNIHFQILGVSGPWGATGGSGRGFLFQRAPIDVAIRNVTLQSAQKCQSDFYFGSGGFPVRFVVNNVNLAGWSSSYSWKMDNHGQGLATFKTLAPDAAIDLAPGMGAALTGYPLSMLNA